MRAFSTWTAWYAVVVGSQAQTGAARTGWTISGKWLGPPRIWRWPWPIERASAV
jgi:hypothetical protein